MIDLFIDQETATTDRKPLPGADKFNGDLSKWDVLNVIDMQSMFQHASSFNADLSKWDVSSVTDMVAMFGSASSFNIDISKWDVSSVENMADMFFEASSFEQTLCGEAWLTSTADKEGMFDGSPGRICATSSTATMSTSTTTTSGSESTRRRK